jgi:hypothetical protein
MESSGIFQCVSVLPPLLQKHYQHQIMSEPSFTYQNEKRIKTIGLPFYKAAGIEEYTSQTNLCRSVFLERFAPLYEFVIHELIVTLGVDVRISELMAPPGFHIITSTPEDPFWGGHWHVDTFPTCGAMSNPVLTVTLLLGGFPNLFCTEFGESDHEFFSVHHHPGRITVFPSILRHRIGSFSAIDGPIVRTTLQAHLSWRFDHFEIYW